jgi:NAD dependent epimerase/dehydratase
MTDWSGARALVTGAGGFIGSHLTEWLVRQGASVRAFVRYNSRNDYGWLESLEPGVYEAVEIFRGDLANAEAAMNAVVDCDVVFHLGALIPIPYSYVHAREYVSANVVGTLNILEAARRHRPRRIVHVSTSEVYGTAQHVPISEDHPLHPQSPYAATKVGADQLALTFQLAHDLPVVVARPFNTYGPRQSARAVIPTIISQALTRGEISLGSLTPTRDFCFVEDTARGMAACAAADGVVGETINLGTGSEISVLEVVERVFALIGRDLPVAVAEERLRPPGSEVERLVADARKAEQLLGWRAEVSFDEGLARTVEWIQSAPEAFKASLYNV